MRIELRNEGRKAEGRRLGKWRKKKNKKEE